MSIIPSSSSGDANYGKFDLPEVFCLRDGQTLSSSSDIWQFLDISWGVVSIRFDRFKALGQEIRKSLKYFIGRTLETRSASYARNLFTGFVHFYSSNFAHCETGEVEEISLGHILTYRSHLDPRSAWRLGNIRITLEGASRLGCNFTSKEALDWLDAAVIPGNPKGADVRTRDPNHGPFSASEVETLNASLNQLYADGGIDLSDFAAGHIFLGYGIRPRQLAALKERDLIVTLTGGGEKVYLLRIPQAKQRGELIRDSFRTRPCDRRLGKLLERLIEENSAFRIDPEVAENDWPMFIGSRAGPSPPGFAYHKSGNIIANRIKSILSKQAGIKANAKRFRDTLAQNMADDGASIYEIAEALGHADTQQVGKYVEARPEMVSRLNHLAEEFAPILQAFAGVLIPATGAEAQSAPKARLLHDRALDSGGSEPLGHCGQHSFCDLAKPIGCYTCRSFRAWDDGPHEEILAKLMSDRQQKIAMGLSSKIYGINDRTIAAVTRVAQLCKEQSNGTVGNEAGRL